MELLPQVSWYDTYIIGTIVLIIFMGILSLYASVDKSSILVMYVIIVLWPISMPLLLITYPLKVYLERRKRNVK